MKALILTITLAMLALANRAAFANDPNAPCVPPQPGQGGPTPVWDQQINNASRFTCLSDWNSHAVRDNETGLVWEHTPIGGTGTPPVDWHSAIVFCHEHLFVNRGGWRLPTVEELMSLVDNTTASGLPPNAPFLQVAGGAFWSATTYEPDPAFVYTVRFPDGAGFDSKNSNTDGLPANQLWCVRGGSATQNPF